MSRTVKPTFMPRKGPGPVFGVYITHLSILIIFIGSLMRSFWGYKAYVSIPEGGESATIYRRDQQAKAPLGFTVRCEAFSASVTTRDAPPPRVQGKIYLFISRIISIILTCEDTEEEKRAIIGRPLAHAGCTLCLQPLMA